ncbi:MAG TPA: hypothetical protein VFA15_02805 [Nitrososphaera sp.]|nr:hypothetical protein [Nitrososphaera sp.]
MKRPRVFRDGPFWMVEFVLGDVFALFQAPHWHLAIEFALTLKRHAEAGICLV